MIKPSEIAVEVVNSFSSALAWPAWLDCPLETLEEISNQVRGAAHAELDSAKANVWDEFSRMIDDRVDFLQVHGGEEERLEWKRNNVT